MRVENGILMGFDLEEKNLMFPNNMTGMSDEAQTAEILLLDGIESISVEAGNPTYYAEGNCLIHKAEKRLILGCKNSTIPEGIESIEYYAFPNDGPEELQLPNSLRIIGGFAFQGCPVKHIRVPKNVDTLYPGALSGCSSLESISVDPENMFYYSRNNCLIDRRTKALVACCNNPIVPEGVEIIEQLSFWGLFRSTKLTLPYSLHEIRMNEIPLPTGLGFPNNSALVHDSQVQSAVFYAPKGSYAIQFAKTNGLTYQELP